MVGKSSGRLGVVALAGMVLSTLLWIMSLCSVAAHEVRPSVADAVVGPHTVRMDIRLSLEPLIAGIDLAGLDDTDESPLSGLYDRLREQSPIQLEAALREVWPSLSKGFKIISGGSLIAPTLVSVTIPEVGDVELPRDSRIVVEGLLPEGMSPVQVGWSSSFGPLVVRQAETGSSAVYSAILNNGDLSEPLPRDGLVTEDALTVFVRL